MSLTTVKIGEVNCIKGIGGQEKTRRFLESLGFVIGGKICIISRLGESLIVHVKESRVAISAEMADKIMV
ncbi:MAG: FeoA family protein [Lachnospiraceae bacterium]